jgi:hypothetical protein
VHRGPVTKVMVHNLGSDSCKFNLNCVSNSHDSHGIRTGHDGGGSLEILQ